MEGYTFIGLNDNNIIKKRKTYFLDVHYRDYDEDIWVTVYRKGWFGGFFKITTFSYGSMQQFGYNWKKVEL